MSKKWGVIQIEGQPGYKINLGLLQLYLLRQEKRLLFEKEQVPEPAPSLSIEENEERLPHYGMQISFSKETISIRPVLPDNPIVIKPDSSVRINEHSSAMGYVVIPVRLAFSFGKFNYNKVFIDEESIPLSQTWLGVPDKGELAWSFTTCFSQSQPREHADYQVVVPVLLKTVSSGYIDITKFVLRTSLLNIYISEDGYLYSDQQTVLFQDAGTEKDVQISKGGLDKNIKLSLLTEARDTNNKNIITKSFSFFKSIYQ